MTPLLYLVHRIPFPPDKGDKIRSYNILRFLARTYRVYLGAFVDSVDDRTFGERIAPYCADVFLQPLNPVWSRIKSCGGFLKGTSLTVPYYDRAAMHRWVDNMVKSHDIDRAVVFSSSMAQYVSGRKYQGLRRVIDFVDIDSEKWKQYSEMMPWPLSWVYRREARTLLEYETKIAHEFEQSTFVSEAEVNHFRSLVPEVAQKVACIPNGVDLDYFDPAIGFSNPFRRGEKPIVFTGAMDYWANADAVAWFATRVLPEVRARISAARFYIVGSKPSPHVQTLAGDGVVVTGRVPDVRPYLAHASVVVAPLRVARGIQNKVLEAMAMNCHVVCTQKAAAGIPDLPGREFAVVDNAAAMANAVALALTRERDANAKHGGRGFVVRHYDWSRNLETLSSCLEDADKDQRFA